MKCENCEIEHNGEYGGGRFCSSKCARSFSTKEKRKEINEKVSNSLKHNGNHFNPNPKKRVDVICENCGNSFEVRPSDNRRFCSRNCYINKSKEINKNSGGYRKGSGRSKGSYYKNNWFDSPFEIEVAKFLDENDIKWVRNTKRFYFDWGGKKTYYIPDFYIKEIDLFLCIYIVYNGHSAIKIME